MFGRERERASASSGERQAGRISLRGEFCVELKKRERDGAGKENFIASFHGEAETRQRLAALLT